MSLHLSLSFPVTWSYQDYSQADCKLSCVFSNASLDILWKKIQKKTFEETKHSKNSVSSAYHLFKNQLKEDASK